GTRVGRPLHHTAIVGRRHREPRGLRRRAGHHRARLRIVRGPTTRATIVLLALFALSLPAVTTRLYASDEIEYYSWLRSFVFDHDVNFTNEYSYFYDTGATKNPDFHRTFLELKNEKGLATNFAPVGTAVLWAPFFAAGHVAAAITGAPRDG